MRVYNILLPAARRLRPLPPAISTAPCRMLADISHGASARRDRGRHLGAKPDPNGRQNLRCSADASFSPRTELHVKITDRKLANAAGKAIRDYEYESVLADLQAELVVLQESLKARGQKVVVLFEGRDAAGKGGCISRITDAMSPRICRVVALGTPTDAEKSQWYFRECRPSSACFHRPSTIDNLSQ